MKRNVAFFMLHDIIHLLDSEELDIRFVVQIEPDVGRSKALSLTDLEDQLFRLAKNCGRKSNGQIFLKEYMG